jgi:hypothetical protein
VSETAWVLGKINRKTKKQYECAESTSKTCGAFVRWLVAYHVCAGQSFGGQDSGANFQRHL